MKPQFYPMFKAFLFILTICILHPFTNAQKLQDFNLMNTSGMQRISEMHQFNGYTNHWHDIYTEWHRYGNLFKMSRPQVEQNIMQSKLDVAEDLGLPGFVMQEGFLKNLLAKPFTVVPFPEELNFSNLENQVLLLIDSNTELGKSLEQKASSAFGWLNSMESYQLNDSKLEKIKAFQLQNDGTNLFVISTSNQNLANELLKMIESTKDILDKYRLEKGWFGVSSLLKSVTCAQGHPIELMGLGMNEGNSWFVFDGYMDFLAQQEMDDWVEASGLPIVADVGFSPIYGCSDYEGLQVQDMATPQAWIDYAHSKGGYAFRQVYHPDSDDYEFDGYIVHEGNKTQIDQENKPFINKTGYLSGDLTSSMILFIEKEKELSKKTIWEAIMNRKEVAILEKALVMGPASYRKAMQLLYLDRIFLESYFKDHLNIQSHTDGYNLVVNITNYSNQKIQGEISLAGSPYIHTSQDHKSVQLNPGQSIETIFPLNISKGGMGKSNPIAIHMDWDGKRKSTLQMMDMPPTISIHQLLYGHAPSVAFPVTIHNHTDKQSFPVAINVFHKNNPGKSVFTDQKTCKIASGKYEQVDFQLELGSGNYIVQVEALEAKAQSQLGVGGAEGKPYLYEVDLNSDGINEYRMENDSVQITLLRTGARVIEYIVKSKQDNVLFKIWPEKTYNHKRPFRMRGFYPYGGFEDFLGQASMETHKIYDARIIRDEGDFVRVEMETEYYGNKLKKIFTLYGNSPLLEVRFELDFHNPEANVLGPQPILSLGEDHGTEDIFTVPTTEGLVEYRMRPEKYYGQAIQVQEGWNAGYETQEDISFVGAFPVSQPIFLHMWMNHPRNQEAPHYYVEFQPWTPIIQKTTMYFSYYLWGSGGPYQNSLDELRQRNLITVRN